jgi:hypothetical protein
MESSSSKGCIRHAGSGWNTRSTPRTAIPRTVIRDGPSTCQFDELRVDGGTRDISGEFGAGCADHRVDRGLAIGAKLDEIVENMAAALPSVGHENVPPNGRPEPPHCRDADLSADHGSGHRRGNLGAPIRWMDRAGRAAGRNSLGDLGPLDATPPNRAGHRQHDQRRHAVDLRSRRPGDRRKRHGRGDCRRGRGGGLAPTEARAAPGRQETRGQRSQGDHAVRADHLHHCCRCCPIAPTGRWKYSVR